jgi:hypothetical protein
MVRYEYDPHCAVCRFIATALKLALSVICLLIIISGAFEVALRFAKHQPIPIATRGLSATVADSWTDWAMRPSVSSGPEYVWTNAYGLHEDREIALSKPNDVIRVAVVGSSVVWGPGHNFPNTIPRAAEIKLKEEGCAAEVINFGNMGFNGVNISSLMQVRVHQFNPDVVVLVADLQVVSPQWPAPQPISAMPEHNAIVKLPWYKALFVRASEHSALLSLLYSKPLTREFLERNLHLRIEQPAIEAPVSAEPKVSDAVLTEVLDNSDTVTVASVGDPEQDSNVNVEVNLAPKANFYKPSGVVGEDDESPAGFRGEAGLDPFHKNNEVMQSENDRSKELGAIIAAISSFYSRLEVPLYLMTPYGPYFNFTDDELKTFSLNMLADEARLYGSMREALARQVVLATTVLSEVGSEHGASVIDMLEASRTSDGFKNKDFSNDAIHFSAQGNRNVGEIIANRLLRDGVCDRR